MCLCLTLLGCGGAKVAEVPTPGPSVEGATFGGVWYSQQFDQMYLRQIGEDVRGIYTHNYGGTLEGKIQGDMMVFKWIEPGDRTSAKRTHKGNGYFRIQRLDDGGLKLEGRWGYEDSASNGGIWSAERIREMDEGDPRNLEEFREKYVR